MIFCPNKNLPEWKELVDRLGDEDLAYFEWNRKYGDFNQAPVKTIKNGVPELFDSNPELANIGTPEQYSQYLDTIFPDSKVKDIVYRGSEKGIEKELNPWLYFSDSKADANMYAKAHISKGGKATERNPIPVIKSNIGKKYNLNKDVLWAITDDQKGVDGLEREGFISKEDATKARDLLLNNKDVQNLKRLIELYPIVKIESELDLMKQFDDEQFILNKPEYDRIRKELEPFFDREQVGKLETVILNIKNPLDGGSWEDLVDNREAYKNNHDGAILLSGEHFMIKNKLRQVHILGSQKDMLGFKKFTDKVNQADLALEHQETFTMEELSAMMYENAEIDFNTEELVDSPIDKLYDAYSETFSENQISKGKLEELLSKGVSVNSIEEWTKSCLIGGGKGAPKAKDGMSFNFTPGGKWKLVKDLQGYPTHEKGGVDLYIGKNGVSMASGESSLMAEKGLVMPNQTSSSDGNPVVSELYTQKTGKPWSSAKAEGLTTGTYDDNMKLRQRLIDGEFDNKETPPKFIPNTSNSQPSVYDQAINFNDAFRMAREQLGPNQIFEYQGRKYGTNLKGETFEPSQEILAQHNMNIPKVKKRLQDQNEKVVSPFTSKNTTKLEPEYKNWEEKKEDIADFNKMDEADKIINYQSKNNTGKNYVIIDKKKGLLHIYDGKSNEPIYTSAVDIGAATENKDDQTVTKYIDRNNDGKITDADKPFRADYSKGNQSTGAGIYYISNIGEYQGMPSLNMMNERQYENFLKTGKVENVGTSFHRGYIKDDETRVSNGCIRCNRTTLNNLVRNLENSSQVFILPEEEGNSFVVENGKLLFKGNINAPKNDKGEFINPETNQVSNVPYYKDSNGEWQKGQGLNTSPTTLNYIPIKLELNEELFKENVFQTFDFNDEKELITTRSFISALENNKQRVMRAVKISGDVYNDIAKIAFGIYGTESNFGDTHSALGNLGRAVRKVLSPKTSSSPDVVSKATTYGASNDNNSVGYTQIRWSQLNNREKEALRKLNINSNKDLLNPEKSAVATVAILGIRYQEQLTPEQRKDIDTYLPKTWNNRSNYASRVKTNSQYLNVYELN